MVLRVEILVSMFVIDVSMEAASREEMGMARARETKAVERSLEMCMVKVFASKVFGGEELH